MAVAAGQALAGKLTITAADEGKRMVVLGDHLRLLVTGTETNGAYMIMEQTNEPGVSVPLHYHTREHEMFHVIEGTVRYTANGVATEAGPGTVVAIPPGVVHGFEFVTKGRVHVTCVPAGIEDMFGELGQLPAGPPDFEKVTEICGRYGIYFVAQ